eukprot:9032467-Lingulodinium_polyedra.AAC.1
MLFSPGRPSLPPPAASPGPCSRSIAVPPPPWQLVGGCCGLPRPAAASAREGPAARALACAS